MANQNNNQEKIVSTYLHSVAYFNNADATKSKKLTINLFNRGIYISVYGKDGEVFAKKQSRGFMVGQYSLVNMLDMLISAREAFAKGKEFEMCMSNSKSAFGVFGMKKDDVLVGGYGIYDVADGLVIQGKRDFVPVMPKNEVKSFDKQGTLVDVTTPAFLKDLDVLIGLITAILNRTSTVYDMHMKKFYAENGSNNNGGGATGYVASDESGAEDGDEFPF